MTEEKQRRPRRRRRRHGGPPPRRGDARTGTPTDAWHIDVFAEESRPPYDRVALTTFFSGRDPEDLLLGDPDCGTSPACGCTPTARCAAIDTEARQVHARGRTFDYDALVLATGSSAAVPPVPGADLPGSFVYRTVDDVTELRAWVTDRDRTLRRPVRGAVVGGGLLGLEAAGALHGDGRRHDRRGVRPPADAVAGRRGRWREPAPADRAARRRGAHRHRHRPGQGRPARSGGPDGLLRPRRAQDGAAVLDVDLVVFATGVRARATSSPARPASPSANAAASSSTTPARPPYPTCTPSARSPASRAASGAWSAPATRWPRSSWTGCSAATATFPGADVSTKLKLLGVDVASFGDAFAAEPGSLEVVYADPVAGVYKKLVLSDDAQTLLGGVLVGDASAYAIAAADGRQRPRLATRPPGCCPRARRRPSARDLPDEAGVCSCNNVTAGTIRAPVPSTAAPTSPA